MGVSGIKTGEELMELLSTEVSRLGAKQNEGELSGGDIQVMEKLAKIYHVLCTEGREAEKGLGKLSDADLESLVAGDDSGEGLDTP